MNKLLVAVLLSITCNLAVAEFDYNSYQNKPLAEILLLGKSLAKEVKFKSNSIVVLTQPEKYFFTLKYSGKFVKIDSNFESFFIEWARVGNGDKQFISLYSEALVIEGFEIPVYVPVQSSVIPYLKSELKVGQEFQIYAVSAGWLGTSPVLLVTEFDAK